MFIELAIVECFIRYSGTQFKLGVLLSVPVKLKDQRTSKGKLDLPDGRMDHPLNWGIEQTTLSKKTLSRTSFLASVTRLLADMMDWLSLQDCPRVALSAAHTWKMYMKRSKQLLTLRLLHNMCSFPD